MFDTHTDAGLIAVITAFDRQALPMHRRFDGDDDALREAMTIAGHRQMAANMALIAGLAMREALTRGLTIPVSN